MTGFEAVARERVAKGQDVPAYCVRELLTIIDRLRPLVKLMFEERRKAREN
jgi:hypothetical protein